MWAAKHCSMLFSSGQNRLCVFCCVGLATSKYENPTINLLLSKEAFEKSHKDTDLYRPMRETKTWIFFQQANFLKDVNGDRNVKF